MPLSQCTLKSQKWLLLSLLKPNIMYLRDDLELLTVVLLHNTSGVLGLQAFNGTHILL